jgi:hypothetical protein
VEEGTEGGREEIPSRHPLSALSFGVILTFVGGRIRRGKRANGQSATAVAEQERVVADRTGIYSLLAAEAVGQVGNMMVFVAGPWFVLETTGSAARTGIVTGALAMGAVIPAVLGGPLVDRLGHKRASVLADLASAVTVAAMPLLYLADALQFWQLVLLVFLLSSLNAQGDTARYALVPFLAGRARMPIERANGARPGHRPPRPGPGADPGRDPDRGHRRRQRAVRGRRQLPPVSDPGHRWGALGSQPRRAGPSRTWT